MLPLQAQYIFPLLFAISNSDMFKNNCNTHTITTRTELIFIIFSWDSQRSWKLPAILTSRFTMIFRRLYKAWFIIQENLKLP
jgi:hypothetical protein